VQGCVPYPVYKTVQRGQSFLVQNEHGKPMAGALVTYISNFQPHGSELRFTRQTDEQGRAGFPTVREWQTESFLMMHGIRAYSWSWCITASGYETGYSSENGGQKGEEGEEVVVDLKPGPMTACRSLE
jgi:hypothetical protein